MEIIQALFGGWGGKGQEKNEEEKQFYHVGQEGIPTCREHCVD